MPRTLDPQLKRALTERVRYYREMGIYDLYRRPVAEVLHEIQPDTRDEMTPKSKAAVAVVDENLFVVPKPEAGTADPAAALRLIREDLGDCTRCPLHKQGRKQIVFGVGNPRAELMFIGEAPGADEDQQ